MKQIAINLALAVAAVLIARPLVNRVDAVKKLVNG